MPKYEIKLEFFGKYLKTTVEAETEHKAIEAITKRINILSVEPVIECNEYSNKDMFNHLWNIINGKKNN
jgi:hypothetical protein